MQKFKVVLDVTVNTSATVSESELTEELKLSRKRLTHELRDYLAEWDGGNIEVVEVSEQ